MNSTIKIVLFLALLFISIQQQQNAGFQCSIANCKYCSLPNICGQCTNNNILSFNASSGALYCSPVTCVITNCMTCYQNNTCQQCNSGFFLTNTSQCNSNQTSNSQLSTNCLWGTNNTNCVVCSYGYTLKSGYCYPTITILSTDTNCLVKMSSQRCQLCSTGYIVSMIGQCISNQNYTLNCSLSNCLMCSNSTTCSQCINGYQINSTNGQCIVLPCNITNCFYCMNSSVCNQCNYGYMLNSTSNFCQPSGFGCNITNCLTCLNVQSCSACKPGYQIGLIPNTFNLICQPLACPFNITNCNACVVNVFSFIQFGQILCDINSCNTNYKNVNGYCVPILDNGIVVCNPTTVPNCAQCSFPNYCSKCNNGYSLTMSGQCEVTQCNVANCISCGLSNICQQCENNFQLNTGYIALYGYTSIIAAGAQALTLQCSGYSNISCTTIANCFSCSSNEQCSGCIQGYNLMGNLCVPICNITNCYQCSNTTACIACQPNYVIGSLGTQCNPISFSCGFLCTNGSSCIYNLNTQTAQCTNCMTGSILYNGTCYLSTCSIYGCEICAPWAMANTLCLQCQQSLILADGYCMKPNCDNKVPNCVNCIQGGKCIGCAQGFLLQNTSGTVTCVNISTIKNCNVQNCLSCAVNSSAICNICASPYVPRNGNCVCSFKNCLDCSTSALACNLCPTPLIATLQDADCIPQPSLSNKCNISNCQSCLSSTQCSICSIGYMLNRNDYSCNMNNCSALNMPNCQICDQFGYSCFMCTTGYMIDNFLQGGSCYLINTNYTCNIIGCAVCSSTNNSICSSCLPTYYSNSLTSCLPNGCNIINCYLCLDNNICTVCDTGYFLSNIFIELFCLPKFNSIINCENQIMYCDICVSGLYNSFGTAFCIKCQNGFQFNIASGQCMPQMNSIPNCKVQLPDYTNNNLPMCMVCQQGYYINSWGLCSMYNPAISNTNCTVYNCLYCALNSTTCSFCFVPWGISQTGICATNATSICGNLSNCASCINSTYCTTCAITYLPNQTGQCVLCNIMGCNLCNNASICASCQSGYLLNSVGLCISCNIANCSNCINNNICSACASGLVISTTGGSCVVCNIINCTSCISNNSCGVCNNGYQFTTATSTSQCVSCNNVANCILCSSNNFCMNCALGYQPNIIDGKCYACNYPCSTCNNNGNCITCQTPFFLLKPVNGSCAAATVSNCLSYTITNVTTNTSVCNQCNNGFSLNSTSNTCNSICNTNCLTCANSSSPSVCTTCNMGYYVSSNSTCVLCSSTGCILCTSANTCDICGVGFYNSNGQCIQCPGFCATCSSASICLTLISPMSSTLVLINGATYLAICPQGCSTCSSLNPLVCLSCVSGYYLNMNNNVCSPCSQQCMTCNSTNPAICLSCYANNFLNTITNSCTQCNSSCETCLSTSLNQCLSCYPGSYLVLINSQPTCIQGCSTNCITCSAPSICTICSSGYTVFQQQQINSNQINTICVQCVSNCRTCATGLPATCLQCGTGFYLSNGQCIACTTNCLLCNSGGCISCISNFFLTSSLTCSMNCQIPCATCSSNNPTKCSSCIAGYMFNSLSYTCASQLTCAGACTVCPIGAILINGQCNNCNAMNCQVCLPTNLTKCVSCMPGYYINGNQCQTCLPSCATCARSDGCLTCANGFTFNSLVPIQSSGYQCTSCSFPCATCLNTADYCTSCVNGYQFNGWKCAQIFNFMFVVKLLTNSTVFNKNYNLFVQALSSSLSSTNPNIVTITGITFGSVIVNGGVAPTVQPFTLQSFNQFNDLQSALSQNSQIAGMTIGSSSVTVTGGSIDFDKVDLGLILGICIPVGVLIIIGIVIYVYRKNKQSIIIEENIKDDPRFSNRQSFELSKSYKENNNAEDTGRQF